MVFLFFRRAGLPHNTKHQDVTILDGNPLWLEKFLLVLFGQAFAQTGEVIF